MNHITFWLLANLLLTAICADAQQQTKIPKLGWLALRPTGRIATSPSGSDLFWREFSKLGYAKGKNIHFEFHTASNHIDRLPALAEELVRQKVDIIIAPGVNEAAAAKKSTKAIPIVFIGGSDPVKIGLVESLARPGGNLTGFSSFLTLLTGKRLELLKETIPGLSRVAVLYDPKNSLSSSAWKENQKAAKDLGLQLHSMEVSSPDKFESAFNEVIKARSAALTVAAGPFLNSNIKRIIELAAKSRLPAIYARSDFAESGGMMSYSADRSEPYKRLAVMVDKILKGAKPADIPVEQPMAFEFVINLKAAKQIDFTIPPEILARANRIIK